MIDLQKITDFIKKWEGCKLQAYKPIATDPWTIGYGATGGDISEITKWTLQQAEEDLTNRCKFLYRKISSYPGTYQMTDNQFIALVSLAYNIGLGAFLGSTLLLKIMNYDSNIEIASEFGKWIHSGGKVIAGLVNRREAEKELFLT